MIQLPMLHCTLRHVFFCTNIIISSTEITRLAMAKEIKNMEDVQEQHLKDMAAMRKKVNGVFRVNRALAAFQAENF